MDIFFCNKDNKIVAISLVTLDSGVIGSEVSLLNDAIRELLLLLLKKITSKENQYISG